MKKGRHTKRAEFHCHSLLRFRLPYCPPLYDSTQTVEQILQKCLELNIQILCITDHNSMQGYKKAKKIIRRQNLDILLIPSQEVSSINGHVLAYNIKKEIRKGLDTKEAINQIHCQGGIAVPAHPFHPFTVLKMRKAIYNFDFDAIEGYNAIAPDVCNLMAQRVAYKMGLPTIGGSDAHQIEEIGKSSLYFPESTKTASEVVKHIVSRNFSVVCNKTNLFLLVLRHIKKNFKIQKRELLAKQN